MSTNCSGQDSMDVQQECSNLSVSQSVTTTQALKSLDVLFPFHHVHIVIRYLYSAIKISLQVTNVSLMQNQPREQSIHWNGLSIHWNGLFSIPMLAICHVIIVDRLISVPFILLFLLLGFVVLPTVIKGLLYGDSKVLYIPYVTNKFQIYRSVASDDRPINIVCAVVHRSFHDKILCHSEFTINVINAQYGYHRVTERSCSIQPDDCLVSVPLISPSYYAKIQRKCNGETQCRRGLTAEESKEETQCGPFTKNSNDYVLIMFYCLSSSANSKYDQL